MSPDSKEALRRPTADELPELASVVAQALHFPDGRIDAWIDGWGKENFRLVARGGRIVAALGCVPMGQWFGGRVVPMGAITGVGVVPERRGERLAFDMMRMILEELHEAGVPISALYPSTTQFYRGLGYERSGARIVYSLPLSSIGRQESSLEMVSASVDDEAAFREVYDTRARGSAGNLDRHRFGWDSILSPMNHQAHHYLVMRDGKAEGYVVYTQGRATDPIRALDICALSEEAGRRLLRFFTGHRTQVSELRFPGGPQDLLLHLLPHRGYTVRAAQDWMLRIVDVAGALEARGYPDGLEVEIHIEVQDELLEWNRGRYVAQISGGRARVRSGGEGRIRLGVRGLAALYTGHLTPIELRALGLLESDDAGMGPAALAFSGPRPWIPDMF